MNIDLGGKLALIGGQDGDLASAIRQALSDNGATVVEIDPETTATALDAAISSHGEPYLLVLVSRGADGVPDSDKDWGSERADFIRTIRHLASRLKRVVSVFSAAGLVPVRSFAEFSADQAGLASLTRTLAMELGPVTVVNAVAVGAYYTQGEEVRTSRFLSHAALQRPASPSEIVSAVLFLADPDNTYVTGHTLNVDGGWAAGYARNF